jgi:myosin-6
MENQKVWVADPTEGFVLGKIVDLGSDEVTVQPFDRKHKPVACPYDRVYFAEDDDNKDVSDNCEKSSPSYQDSTTI